MADNTKPLTTVAGAPVPDNQNSLTAGARGPMLLQDRVVPREARPLRPRGHPRAAHARQGFRRVRHVDGDARHLAVHVAKIFSEIGKKTEMFARFSTVAGERGAADAERDIRGFAVKFYTEEGNWDIVGNNTPGVLLPRPAEVPRPQPRGQARPAHQSAFTREQLGLLDEPARGAAPGHHHHERPRHPGQLPLMHGFGSHTYSFYQRGRRTVLGQVPLPHPAGHRESHRRRSGELIVAGDRESSQRDLFDAIERGDYPKWKLYVQVMPEADAATYRFHPFDLTKVWSQEGLPADRGRRVGAQPQPGQLLRRRRAGRVHSGQLVPGIEFSPGQDAAGPAVLLRRRAALPAGRQPPPDPGQLRRRAAKLVNTYHRDGAMRVDGNQGGVAGIEPNNFGRWAEQPAYADPPSDRVHAPITSISARTTTTTSSSPATCSDS